MIISHIVAVSKNFVIGINNKLPWHLPEDMKYFHKVTDGHIVIMGRKNYLANGKALRKRTNIVISRNPSFLPEDAYVVESIDAALDLSQSFFPEEIFIVGGGEIYSQTLSIVNRIYITIIDKTFEGDTFYPKIKLSDYIIRSKIEKKADANNPYNHTYYILTNKVK